MEQVVADVVQRWSELAERYPPLRSPWVVGGAGVFALFVLFRAARGRPLVRRLLSFAMVGLLLAAGGGLYFGTINKQLGGRGGPLASPAVLLDQARDTARGMEGRMLERQKAIERLDDE